MGVSGQAGLITALMEESYNQQYTREVFSQAALTSLLHGRTLEPSKCIG